MSAVGDLARELRAQAEEELREESAGESLVEETSDIAEQARSARLDYRLYVVTGVPLAMVSVLGIMAIANADSGAAWWLAVTCTVGFAALLLAGGVWLTRDIIYCANRIVISMDRIARGETDFTVSDRQRTDAYGSMARSLEIMRRGTKRLLSLTEREKGGREERESLRRRQEQELLALAEHFDRMVGDVVSSVATAASQVHATASDMARAAEQSTARSEEVARSMEEASAGASSAAAASDEFAMSIGEISRQAADSAEMARKARSTAGEADETISALDQAATQIGQVVELISTIASRTNLLALNASIEAARGGEAGRGFAVVASEVKELASQTTRATEDVAAQIQAIQDSTGASVKALRTVSADIQQIEATAIAIASAVDQQSVAGQDLARSIDRAAQSSENVGQHVREVRENALLTGSAASQVLNSAGELERQASTLRAQVDGFMAKIRTTAAH